MATQRDLENLIDHLSDDEHFDIAALLDDIVEQFGTDVDLARIPSDQLKKIMRRHELWTAEQVAEALHLAHPASARRWLSRKGIGAADYRQLVEGGRPVALYPAARFSRRADPEWISNVVARNERRERAPQPRAKITFDAPNYGWYGGSLTREDAQRRVYQDRGDRTVVWQTEDGCIHVRCKDNSSWTYLPLYADRLTFTSYTADDAATGVDAAQVPQVLEWLPIRAWLDSINHQPGDEVIIVGFAGEVADDPSVPQFTIAVPPDLADAVREVGGNGPSEDTAS